jgi:hypothetical protein
MRILTRILISYLCALVLLLAPAAELRAQGAMFFGANVAAASSGPSIGNSVSAENATQSSTVTTSAITITAGQALIGASQACYSSGCGISATGSQAITDSAGDSWVCPAGAVGNYPTTGYFTVQLCYVCSAVGGSTTFTSTVTTTGTAYYPGIGVAAINGTILASGCGDTSAANGAQGFSTTPAVTSNAVAGSGEFVFAVVEAEGVVLTNGQTLALPAWNGGQAALTWVTGPASGTQAMTWTANSDPWAAAVMALKP